MEEPVERDSNRDVERLKINHMDCAPAALNSGRGNCGTQRLQERSLCASLNDDEDYNLHHVPSPGEKMSIWSANNESEDSNISSLRQHVAKLLDGVRIRRRRSVKMSYEENLSLLREWLFKFRSFVIGIPSRIISIPFETKSGSKVLTLLHQCLSPFARRHDPPLILQFAPPVRCDVVGSYMVDTLIKPDW